MTDASSPARKNGKLRILIVEDEALVAMEEEAVLSREGFDVIGLADDLASATAYAENNAIDLALVDMRLGADSGFDVAHELSKHGIDSIFITGNCPGESGSRFGLGCLHKPFTPRNLVEVVKAAVELREGRQPCMARLPVSFHIFRKPVPA